MWLANRLSVCPFNHKDLKKTMDRILSEEIAGFINFSLERSVYHSCPIDDYGMIDGAFEETVLDFRYHFPKMSEVEIKDYILRNNGGLPVFLYRLVRKMRKRGYEDDFKFQIHSLMKILCGCEIYWKAEIGEGFLITHGLGTVIGARSKIGKGFWIHNSCIVGQKSLKGVTARPKIGNNVILCANSLILGDITVGDNTIVAANSLVIHNVDGNQIVAGSPAKKIETLEHSGYWLDAARERSGI